MLYFQSFRKCSRGGDRFREMGSDFLELPARGCHRISGSHPPRSTWKSVLWPEKNFVHQVFEKKKTLKIFLEPKIQGSECFLRQRRSTMFLDLRYFLFHFSIQWNQNILNVKSSGNFKLKLIQWFFVLILLIAIFLIHSNQIILNVELSLNF